MVSREEKIRVLMTIRDTSAQSDINAAKSRDIAEKLSKTYSGMAIMLYRLRLDGLIFSPIRGCNRLTDTGTKFLEDILTSTEPMIANVQTAKS